MREAKEAGFAMVIALSAGTNASKWQLRDGQMQQTIINASTTKWNLLYKFITYRLIIGKNI